MEKYVKRKGRKMRKCGRENAKKKAKKVRENFSKVERKSY